MSFRPIYHLNLDPPGVWGCPPLSCRRLRLMGPPGLEGLPEANYNLNRAVLSIYDRRFVITVMRHISTVTVTFRDDDR